MLGTMKFEDFQFQPIDVTVTGTPNMHITRNGIAFTRRLVEDMGYPQYVKPMIDITNKVFALKVCKADSEYAVRFSKPKGEQKRAVVTHASAVRQIIRSVMGSKWQGQNRYHVAGVWYAEDKAMLFDLSTAKELPPFKVVKKNRGTPAPD